MHVNVISCFFFVFFFFVFCFFVVFFSKDVDLG